MIPQGGESCFGGFFYWLPGVSIIRGDWLAGYHIPGRLKNQIMRRILNQYQKYFNPLSVDQVGSNYEKTVGRKSHWTVPLICNLKVVFYYIFWTKMSNSVSGLLIFLLKSGPATTPPPPKAYTSLSSVGLMQMFFIFFCLPGMLSAKFVSALQYTCSNKEWQWSKVNFIYGFYFYFRFSSLFFFRNHFYN